MFKRIFDENSDGIGNRYRSERTIDTGTNPETIQHLVWLIGPGKDIILTSAAGTAG